MRNVPPNLFSVRGAMGCCFLLHDGDNSLLLDTGLAGELFFIRQLFRRLRLTPQSLKAIELTLGAGGQRGKNPRAAAALDPAAAF